MQHSSPPRQKYPPLTAAQQQQVLNYRKIATDFARRLTISYERLITDDDTESIAMLALCQAAQRFDPARAISVWPLAQLRIRQRVFECLCDEMRRGKCRISLDSRIEQSTARAVNALLILQAQRVGDDVTTYSDLLEAPTAAEADRDALRVIAEWASVDPTRAETIDRAIAGDDLTPGDLDLLESLRDELGMLTPEAVDVATAAQRLGRSRKALRSALVKGTVPGYRCGATWRVYLGAALRCA